MYSVKKIFLLVFALFNVAGHDLFSQPLYTIVYKGGKFFCAEFASDTSIITKSYDGFNGITKDNLWINFPDSNSVVEGQALPIYILSPLFSLCTGGKWALFDWHGKPLTAFKYDLIFPLVPENNSAFISDSAFALASLSGKWGLLNQRGEEITPIVFSLPYINDISSTTLQFYFPDNTTKTCDPYKASCNIHFLEQGVLTIPMVGINLILIRDGKYGAIDLTERETIPFIYNEVITSKTGYHRAQRNGKWGYLDDTGQEVIECKYDVAYDFGLTEVVIPETGEIKNIPTAKVVLKKKLFMIDYNGNKVEIEE